MRSVFITGAFGGLGRELVKAFLSFDKVFAQGRTLEETSYPNVLPVYGSLFDIPFMFTTTFYKEEDGLDVLINNAAVYMNKPFSEMSAKEINTMLSVNLHAPILLSRILWDKLKKRKGIIVNINSLAGKYGAQGESLYCATKHGLAGFSKALQFDATKDGIRVVNIYCGAMRTKMSGGRKDWDKFISPKEVAAEVLNLYERRDTLRVTEIEFMRSQY